MFDPLSHLFPCLLLFRCAGWSRQQSELHRSIHGWHGVLHGILGQLPQDLELRLFIAKRALSEVKKI